MPGLEYQYLPPEHPGGERIESPVRPLHDMFATVPDRYDLLNRVMTWGLDERWRRQAARECLCHNDGRVLDLCCGTGDLALHLSELAEPGREIVGLDFCEPMLEVARSKADSAGLGRRITFLPGDAVNIPFPNGYFTALGISFAFRNITYRNPLRLRYLAEMVRVLAPGGKCVIVETSQPANLLLRAAFHLYLKRIVSGMGGFLSGPRGAYRYLAESARRFYKAEEVSHMLVEAGFREVQLHRLLGGVAAIHVAIR